MSSQDASHDAPLPLPAVALIQMATGHMVAQAIYAATKLGIPDLVADGPKPCEALARAVGADPSALHRLLRMLAARGVFRHDPDGRVAQSPMSACLQTGRADSLREAVLLWNDEQYRAWGALLYSIRTGDIGFDHVFGTPWFDYLEQHAEPAKVFSAAMTAWTRQAGGAVADAYDFSTVSTLVDVGGGHGIMLTSILDAFSGLRGVLFERPSVVAEAQQSVEAVGLSGRCEVISGDFFAEVARGGDAYLLSQILHDWDDERSLVILRNCHDAMASGGRLLVIETLLSSEADMAFSTLSDLHMLVVLGGRERTEREYRDLFARAGFHLTRVLPTAAPQSIVEGVPV
jgi:hypothetical protein